MIKRKIFGRAPVFALAVLTCCSFGKSDTSTLVLRNNVWNRVKVEAVVTRTTDCEQRTGGFIRADNFEMGKNQTHRIEAPNGAIICWRHDRNPNDPESGGWSGWSKATLFPGETTETDL